MDIKSFENWLDALGQAWITRNSKAAAEICAENILYFETPFDKPLTSFTRLPSGIRDTLNGAYIVKLNDDGLCKEFHRWWVVKPK